MKQRVPSIGLKVLDTALVVSLVLGSFPGAVALAEAESDVAGEEVAVEVVETEEEAVLEETTPEGITSEETAVDDAVVVEESEPEDQAVVTDEAEEVVPQLDEELESYSDSEKRNMGEVESFKNGQSNYDVLPDMPYAKGSPVVFKDLPSLLDLRYGRYDEESETWVYDKLVLGTDYTVRYENNTSIGDAYVVAVGQGDYEGELYIPFHIYSTGGKWYKVSGKWRYDAGEPLYEYQGEMYSYPRNGFFSIDGTTYLFNDKGDMLTGWQKWTRGTDVWVDEEGVEHEETWTAWYYLESSDALAKGWKKLSGKWYYLSPTDGAMAVGLRNIEEGNNSFGYYLFSESGVMQTGWVKQTYTGDDGKSYSYWYYFKSNGKGVVGWNKIGGKWYFFSPFAEMLTGWIEPDGYSSWGGTDRYYLDPKSGAMVTGWKKITDTVYDEEDNEQAITGWYYFASSGKMATGWVKSGSSWYYMNPDGRMATGWLSIDAYSIYYLKSSGAMATGWQKIGDGWFYFGTNGTMVRDKWVQKYYYIAPDGFMMQDGITPDGYRIVNGRWDGKGKVA